MADSANILIVVAPYYKHITDQMIDGAQRYLDKESATHEVVEPVQRLRVEDRDPDEAFEVRGTAAQAIGRIGEQATGAIPALGCIVPMLPHACPAIAVATNLPRALCEALARQMLIFNRPMPQDEIVERLDAVTLDDIRCCTEGLLSRPLPTVATIGPKDGISQYDRIAARLN